MLVPTFGDYLGLHCTSIGSRPCGARFIRRCFLGAVDWSADCFQLATNNRLIGRTNLFGLRSVK